MDRTTKRERVSERERESKSTLSHTELSTMSFGGRS